MIIIGTAIEKILPRGKGAEILIDLIARSQQLFGNHDINKVKNDLGENQVSSIWLWGQGKRPEWKASRNDSESKELPSPLLTW